MVAEYIVFVTGESVAADVGEIADIILVHPDVCSALILAQAGHQADLAEELLFCDAVAESRVTGAKDGSENAATRRRDTPDDVRQALPVAKLTGHFRQPDCCRSVPVHLIVAPAGLR